MSPARKTILVVDDQEDERAIQRAMLTHLGYSVRDACDGQSGLEVARQSPPDLILLDVAMPRMDGFEVCRSIRSDARTAGVPVLFLTASVVGELEERAREVGADGVLVKPVDPHTVAEAIRRLVGPPQD